MKIPSFLRACTFIAMATVVYGCTSTTPSIDRTVPEAFPHHTASQIRFNLQMHSDAVRAYKAKASVTIKTPDNSGQFTAEMQGRRNDSVYVSISPGLGIEAARALVTPDSFYFYDRIKNRIIYGSMDHAAEVIPHPFGSENIFENLLGLVMPTDDVSWVVTSDTSYYYLRDPEALRTYVVDPAFWRIVRVEEYTPTGTLVERRTFSDFDTFGGVVLPRRLVFQRPETEQFASVYYRSLTLNPDRLSMTLRTRESADRVQAGE